MRLLRNISVLVGIAAGLAYVAVQAMRFGGML